MDLGDTRRGRSDHATRTGLPLGWKELVSLTCEVTVSCVQHRMHTATVTGPWEDVLNAVGLFREVATRRGHWVICRYEPSEETLPSVVSEWEPPLCK